MGRAGKALKLVLERYGISQNKLAVTMGIDRSIVYKWVHEERDPTAEKVTQIGCAITLTVILFPSVAHIKLA